MTTWIILIILIAVVGGAAYYILKGKKGGPLSKTPEENLTEEKGPEPPSETPSV